MNPENPFAARDLVGGNLALDFANTLGKHTPPLGDEWLHGYDDLVWWSARAGAISGEQAMELLARAAASAGEAADVFARAIPLREAVYRIFSALGAGRPVDDEDLGVLNAELARAGGHQRIAAAGEGFAWEWSGDGLDRVLWPVARAAADLMVSDDVRRIGECAGETCEWLYVDTSRNHSRRWCTMADCGNRAKAKRHYHRVRAPAE